MVWNAIVVAVWLLFSAACVYATIDPNDVNPQYPILFRGLMFMVCVEAFFTAIAYALLDKRILRRRIGFMKDQTFGRALILSGKIILGCVLLFIVLAILAALLYPSS